MTDRTISEQLFESLCSAKAVSCRRIPAGPSKTPDYEIVLDVQRVAVEVKQLDENDEDKRLNRVLDQRLMIEGAVAPTSRLRKQIAEGYRQLKAVAREGRPSLLVVYNNAGVLHYIDSFTVTTAMFGTFGVHLGLSASSGMQVTGQGFMGKRKITRNTCRQLSALAVMSGAARGAIRLDIYHNPYAITPIRPAVIASLADSQFLHPDPHAGNFVSWEPLPIDA